MSEDGSAILTEADIMRLMDVFYARIRRDEVLGPIFATKIEDTDADWTAHRAHIGDFWSSIFLRTKRFKGNPMLKHAAIPGLTPAHFTNWLSLFQVSAEKTLNTAQAAEIMIMARRIAQSLQMGLAINAEQNGKSDHPFQDFGLRRSKLG